jgi:hypothetical protein
MSKDAFDVVPDNEFDAWFADMKKLAATAGVPLPESAFVRENPMLYTFRGNYVLDEKHQPRPVPFLEYILWKEGHRPEMIVAQESIGCYSISTVFLGTDAGGLGEFDRRGRWEVGAIDLRPVLFETMVFLVGDEFSKKRCCTWEEAEGQHAQIVGDLRKAVNG